MPVLILPALVRVARIAHRKAAALTGLLVDLLLAGVLDLLLFWSDDYVLPRTSRSSSPPASRAACSEEARPH